VAAHLLLGKQKLSVDRYIKYSSGRRNQVRLDVEFLAELRRQTGGAGLIVSNDAVSDRDIHGQNRSPGPAGGKGARLILG